MVIGRLEMHIYFTTMVTGQLEMQSFDRVFHTYNGIIILLLLYIHTLLTNRPSQ